MAPHMGPYIHRTSAVRDARSAPLCHSGARPSVRLCVGLIGLNRQDKAHKRTANSSTAMVSRH
jgi:hypothetical protein